MTITARTPLKTIAFAVGDALRRSGVHAVLTGGSCATIHTAGAYQSLDVDFVLEPVPRPADLDRVMGTLGFRRTDGRYVHRRSRIFIEFPPGPLAVGADARVAPVILTFGHARIPALSPTDSCRDRLAAFYHWQDRSSLDVAAQIARRHRVDLDLIKRWSRAEGAERGFGEFLAELQRRKRR